MSPASVLFSVNGKSAELALAADTPLIHALRNDLHLKGTRFGCGCSDGSNIQVMLRICACA